MTTTSLPPSPPSVVFIPFSHIRNIPAAPFADSVSLQAVLVAQIHGPATSPPVLDDTASISSNGASAGNSALSLPKSATTCVLKFESNRPDNKLELSSAHSPIVLGADTTADEHASNIIEEPASRPHTPEGACDAGCERCIGDDGSSRDAGALDEMDGRKSSHQWFRAASGRVEEL